MRPPGLVRTSQGLCEPAPEHFVFDTCFQNFTNTWNVEHGTYSYVRNFFGLKFISKNCGKVPKHNPSANFDIIFASFETFVFSPE